MRLEIHSTFGLFSHTISHSFELKNPILFINERIQRILKRSFKDVSEPDLKKSFNNQIICLTKKIDQYNQFIQSNQNRLSYLESRVKNKAISECKLFIIAALIQRIYFLFNWLEIIIIEKDNKSLLSARAALDLSVSHLKTCLSTIQDIDTLIESRDPSQGPSIFELEYNLRSQFPFLRNESRKKAECYHRLHCVPLLNEAKENLKKTRQLHFVIGQMAARKGSALTQGIANMTAVANAGQIVTSNIQSANQVFIFPDYGVVYKKQTKDSCEKEGLIEELLNFYLPLRRPASFRMKRLSLPRFGIPISDLCRLSTKDERLKRGYPLKDLFNHLFSVDSKKTFVLDKLKALKISLDQEEENMLSLFKNKEWETLQIVPDFLNEEAKSNYESCEMLKWKDRKNEQKSGITFKELQTFYLAGRSLDDFYLNIKETLKHTELWQAMVLTALEQIKWKLIFPELFYSPSKTPVNPLKPGVRPLKNMRVKEFLPHLLLLKDILTNRKLEENIFSRLTNQSHALAIFSGDLQLLDLHSGNRIFSGCQSSL